MKIESPANLPHLLILFQTHICSMSNSVSNTSSKLFKNLILTLWPSLSFFKRSKLRKVRMTQFQNITDEYISYIHTPLSKILETVRIQNIFNYIWPVLKWMLDAVLTLIIYIQMYFENKEKHRHRPSKAFDFC